MENLTSTSDGISISEPNENSEDEFLELKSSKCSGSEQQQIEHPPDNNNDDDAKEGECAQVIIDF